MRVNRLRSLQRARVPVFPMLQRKTVRIGRFVSTCCVIGIGARQRFARSNA